MKFLYKYIKGLRFFSTLFDVNEGIDYELVYIHDLPHVGYFVLKQIDTNTWLVVKSIPIRQYNEYESISYFNRVKLYYMLCRKYSFSNRAKRVMELLNV